MDSSDGRAEDFHQATPVSNGLFQSEVTTENALPLGVKTINRSCFGINKVRAIKPLLPLYVSSIPKVEPVVVFLVILILVLTRLVIFEKLKSSSLPELRNFVFTLVSFDSVSSSVIQHKFYSFS